jgi:hypothetical protein
MEDRHPGSADPRLQRLEHRKREVVESFDGKQVIFQPGPRNEPHGD